MTTTQTRHPDLTRVEWTDKSGTERVKYFASHHEADLFACRQDGVVLIMSAPLDLTQVAELVGRINYRLGILNSLNPDEVDLDLAAAAKWMTALHTADDALVKACDTIHKEDRPTDLTLSHETRESVIAAAARYRDDYRLNADAELFLRNSVITRMTIQHEQAKVNPRLAVSMEALIREAESDADHHQQLSDDAQELFERITKLYNISPGELAAFEAARDAGE